MGINLLLALLAAAFLILTFPGPNIPWLAPIALTPLLIAAAREHRPGRRFLLGEAAGIVYWFGVCYWIQFVLSYHGGMGEAGGWACFLLFCLLKAIHLGVFALLAGYVVRKWYTIPAVAALWVGIERTHGPLGFAWMALGNAGIDMSIPMRLAPWVGVYGLSFLFAMFGTALAMVAVKRPRRELVWVAFAGFLLLLPRLPEARPADRSAVVMQPNVTLDRSWTRSQINQAVDRFALESMREVIEGGATPADVIVWPETPAPFYYETDAHFRKTANNLARVTATSFLFGTVAFTKDRAPLNSARLVGPDGRPGPRYDKIFLVPFGEFVPPLFSFVNRVTSEAGDFTPGREIKLMPIAGHRAGAFICYEAVFPHFVRKFARHGAEVFLNLSNDGYFGRTAARDQHLLIARMRAAENDRWLIRATNNGITVVVDPAGRLRQQLPADRELTARLGFRYVKEQTFYTRHGDWFAWGCLVAGLLLAALGLVRNRRTPKRS